MKLLLCSAISGAGKSTYCKKLMENGDYVYCSADTYFNTSDGYKFDPSQLGNAHESCRKFCEVGMSIGKDVIVDNTNTTWKEIEPYIILAEKYGYEIEIIRLVVDPTVAHSRNQHGLSLEMVQRQHNRLIPIDVLARNLSGRIKATIKVEI